MMAARCFRLPGVALLQAAVGASISKVAWQQGLSPGTFQDASLGLTKNATRAGGYPHAPRAYRRCTKRFRGHEGKASQTEPINAT